MKFVSVASDTVYNNHASILASCHDALIFSVTQRMNM